MYEMDRNGKFWACVDGLLGTEDQPEAGALPQCNADKAAIRKFLEGE